MASACSVVQVVYNQAPNYVYWRMNSALNLDDPQQDVLKSAAHGWFAWNRSAQLPLMARFLVQAQQDALGDLTPSWPASAATRWMHGREPPWGAHRCSLPAWPCP